MDERTAKLESDVAQIARSADENKADLRDFRRETLQNFSDLRKEAKEAIEKVTEKIDKLKDGLWMTRIELLLIGAAIIARVYKWL